MNGITDPLVNRPVVFLGSPTDIRLYGSLPGGGAGGQVSPTGQFSRVAPGVTVNTNIVLTLHLDSLQQRSVIHPLGGEI